MASGKRAFERPTPAQTLSAIIDSEPEPLSASAPKVPTNLLWVVERCLAKDPEDRYGSTKDLARDLATLRDRSSGAPSGSGVAPPERKRLRLSRAALAVWALAVAGLAALTFFAGERVQASRQRAAPPPSRTTLTFRQGFVTGARFAPDGQTIVYSACWDGKPCEIFTTRVGSTDSRLLGIGTRAILAVSSTGELAVSMDCSHRGIPCMGMLARVPLAGGGPREILGGVISADWSPDGKDLAVTGWGASSTRSEKCSRAGPRASSAPFACRPMATTSRSSTIRVGRASGRSLRSWIGPARRGSDQRVGQGGADPVEPDG